MAKNWKKHNQIRDRLMELVPSQLPKEIDSWLDSNCLDRHQYIFYDRKDHYAYCTRCHKQIDQRLLPAVWAKHGDLGCCPQCGEPAEYKCIGKYRKRSGLMMFDEFQVKIIQRTEEGIVFRRFRVIRECHKDRFNRLEEKWYWDELQRIFNDGRTIKNYRAMPEYDYKIGRYTSYWNESRKTDYETVYSIGWVKSLPSFDYDANLAEVIRDTPWHYAEQDQELEYYAAWIKPVEYLEKSDWPALAKDILNHNTKWLNLKADTLSGFLRLPKHAIKYAREADLDVGGLRVLRKLLKQGSPLPAPAILNEFILRFQWKYEEASKIAPAIKIEDWFKYQKYLKDGMNSHLYVDYLGFCKQLEYDMTDPQVLYPKGVKTAHDREMVKIEYKKNEGLENAIRSRFKEDHLKLAYSTDSIMIRPPMELSELLKEGSALSHCVGTYAKKVAENRTTILFIREAGRPEDPFYTLEYSDGKVIQCRGHRNCDMTEEVKAFVEAWKKHLKSKKRKPVAISAAV